MNHEIRVLYVEDEKHIRDELSEILSLDFKELLVACNGEEGLELYKAHRPELVISDIQMPKMDGLLLCKHILEIDAATKIILTTAFSEESHIKSAGKLSVVSYLKKPISLDQLYAAIQTATDALSSKPQH